MHNISMQDLNQEYVYTAKKNGFNPVLLKEIIILRNKGYNNIEIANTLGISRNTVSKYNEKLRKTDDKEIVKIIALTAALVGGAYLLTKLFKK